MKTLRIEVVRHATDSGFVEELRANYRGVNAVVMLSKTDPVLSWIPYLIGGISS